MADFKLSAEIEMQAAQALREIDKVKKATKSTEREFNLLGKSVTLDTQRIAEGIKKITAIAGVMFAAMAIASPSMRAAFKQMEIAAYEMNIALGEQLAPMIEATLVPAMNKLRDIVLNLQPEQQALIALTITLAFVLGLLAIAIAAVTWEIVLVAAIIAVVALAIAGLIIYWDEITEAVVYFISKIPGIENFMASIIDLKDAVLRFWDVAKPIFKVLFVGLLIALSPIIAVIVLAIAGLIASIMLIIPAITLVIDIFTALLNAVSGIMETIKLLIKGDFDEAWDHVKDTFETLIKDLLAALSTFVSTFLEVIVSVVNGVIKVINKVIEASNKYLGTDFGTISEVTTPTFQEGGTVERTGLIFAHRGEEVLRAPEARQFRQQTSSTSGGNTFIFNNVFKIGSISNRSQMLAYARESASMQKREMDRRFHA